MRWLVAISGWVAAWFILDRYRTVVRNTASILESAGKAMAEADLLIEDVYKVKLSCPECDWTDVVVRESREEGMEEGNRRIAHHNALMRHELYGQPRAGYFRGEPLN